MFDALVRRVGGVDAAAAVLEARYGTGHKGTVSKMCSGAIGVTVDAVVALEDCLGAFPMTTMLFERIGREGIRSGDLKDLAARSTVASGQAHAVLIRAFSHLSDGGERITDSERAEVVAEMRAAREVFDQIIASAEVAK